MGKGIGICKRIAAIAVLSALMLCSGGVSGAAETELELFDRGYNYYLSYQPEKAVEIFVAFLAAFPESSTKDAVLFWLGKAYGQLGSIDDARKTLSRIKKEFPSSPYAAFVDREVALLRDGVVVKKESVAQPSPTQELDTKLRDAEARTGQIEQELLKAYEERERLRQLAEEQSRKATEMKAALDALEKKEMEARSLLETRLTESEQMRGIREKEMIEAVQERERLKAMLEEERKRAEGLADMQKAQDWGAEIRALEASRQERDLLEKRVKEAEQKASVAEEEVRKARGESLAVRSSLEEEKKKAEQSQQVKVLLDEREAEARSLASRYESQQQRIAGMEAAFEQLKGEREKISSELRQAMVEKGRAESERDQLQALIGEYEEELITLRERSRTDLKDAELKKHEMELRQKELEQKTREAQEGLVQAREEQDRLRQQVEEEKKRAEESAAALSRIESKDAEARMALEGRLREAEQTAQSRDRERSAALQEKERLRQQLDEEQKRSEEFRVRISRAEEVEKQVKELEASTREMNALQERLAAAEKKAGVNEDEAKRAHEERDQLKAALEELRRSEEQHRDEVQKRISKTGELEKKAEEYNRFVKQLAEERETLDAQVQRLEKEKAQLSGEREELKKSLKDVGVRAVRVGGQRFTAPQIMEYTTHSLSVINKTGIKEMPWRSGVVIDDFINEQILYGEAKRLHVKSDAKKQKELVDRYNLAKAEADYLIRFMTMSALVDKKLRESAGERMVETLNIPFKAHEKLAKASYTALLLQDAHAAKSLPDVQRKHPGVEYTLIHYKDLQPWQRTKMEEAEPGEIIALSGASAYMILKSTVKKLSYRPFDDPPPAMRGDIRKSIGAWISDLRSREGAVVVEQF